jgi:hypothetical protein
MDWAATGPAQMGPVASANSAGSLDPMGPMDCADPSLPGDVAAIQRPFCIHG